MKRVPKIFTVFLSCACLSIITLPVAELSVLTAEAHSGRTDSSGGHRDNQNKSGLGSYHYHCGGYPAHLHPNGICPYSSGSAGQDRDVSVQPSSSSIDYGRLADTYQTVFDADYYYNANADLQASIGTDRQKLFEHFYNHGMAEGRQACRDFNVNIYKENNTDLAAAYGEDLKSYYDHYINTGCHENRICH